jgi:hypothetical protein
MLARWRCKQDDVMDDGLDLDVGQSYCQVCPKSQGCVINDQTHLVNSLKPVRSFRGDMAPSYPGPGGRRPSGRATTIRASPLTLAIISENVTFAEETIEVKGGLRFTLHNIESLLLLHESARAKL